MHWEDSALTARLVQAFYNAMYHHCTLFGYTIVDAYTVSYSSHDDSTIEASMR
jgi:hypothetical protein